MGQLLVAVRALLYAAGFLTLWGWLAAILAHLFVVLVEEPGLAARFGETYLAYRRATNRWIPRLARAA